MSHDLKKCIHILHLVSKNKKAELRDRILADLSCDDEVFGSFCEIAHNYVKGNIIVPKDIKEKLKGKQPAIKRVAKLSPNSKVAKKKKALKQVGKGWSLLIPLVASVLSLLKK